MAGNPSGIWSLYGPNDGGVDHRTFAGDFEPTLVVSGTYALVFDNPYPSPATVGWRVVTSSDQPVVVNRGPVLAKIGNWSTGEGVDLGFPVSATDPDGDALVYSLDAGAPSGAAINPSTGVFIWRPPLTGFSAVTNITIRVTDSGSKENRIRGDLWLDPRWDAGVS